MKKILFLFIWFFLLSSFSFARDWIREEARESIREASYIRTNSLQKPLDSDRIFSKKIILKEEIQNFFSPKKQDRIVNTGSCITGNTLLIRDRLSTKAEEASKKLDWLLPLVSKINYNTTKISSLANDFEKLSFEISKDCLLSDFQKHRNQIKTDLDYLKIEINLLKKHINRLRNR